MKLNADCIRDILLTIEEHSTFNSNVNINIDNIDNYPNLKKYPFDEIKYHVRYLSQCEAINNVQGYDNWNIMRIADLTPSGHEFVNNVRNTNVWQKTLKKAVELGIQTFPALANIACTIISKLS